MSVEVACTCPDGFGLPHSHVYEPRLIPGDTLPIRRPYDSGWVRLWVDWKAVARAGDPR